MDFPALVGSASIVVDSGTKKAGCRPGRNVYRAIYNLHYNGEQAGQSIDRRRGGI